jgi:hypothetical protein
MSSWGVNEIHKTPGRGIGGTRPPEFIGATVSLMHLFWRNQSDCAERVGTI